MVGLGINDLFFTTIAFVHPLAQTTTWQANDADLLLTPNDNDDESSEAR
jgi:hypothetical protein